MAGITGDAAAVPRSLTPQLQRFADLAIVPGEDRPGGQGRDGGMVAVLVGEGEDGAGQPPGSLIAQPGQRLQLRGHRLVPQVVW